MNPDPVLEVSNLSVILGGVQILDGVNFKVQAGDWYAILGPNGAGKSTLVRAVLGLVPIRSGSIRLFGVPAGPDERAKIGYVPQYQHFDYHFPMTVREMVRTGTLGGKRGFHLSYSKKDKGEADAAINRMGISDLADRPLTALSGGERQRAMIARALAGRPELLILDEPTVYVDTPTEEQFYDILTGIADEVTILHITHDIGVVSGRVNKVACLNRTIFIHDSDHLTSDMLAKVYGCPVDLITHGEIPHRVLARHKDE